MRKYEVITNDPWAFISNNPDPLLMITDHCSHGLKWRKWQRITSEVVKDVSALEAHVNMMDPLPCDQHADVPAYLWPSNDD